jgi:hypothetical protein
MNVRFVDGPERTLVGAEQLVDSFVVEDLNSIEETTSQFV